MTWRETRPHLSHTTILLNLKIAVSKGTKMILNFNALEYELNKRIKELYKKRIEYQKLKDDIKDLRYFITDTIINEDIYIDCEYDVSISTIKGSVDYKEVAEYYLNIENIDLEKFRKNSILRLDIKQKEVC
jgi:hypothetical protein